jgi:hypothetical protein
MMTAQLNGSSLKDGQYHEMGPMRFPYGIPDPDTNETYQIQDMQIVFQLADLSNENNADKDEKLQIEACPTSPRSDACARLLVLTLTRWMR